MDYQVIKRHGITLNAYLLNDKPIYKGVAFYYKIPAIRQTEKRKTM